MFISSFVISRSFRLLFVSFIFFLLRQTRLYIAVHCFCLNLRFHYLGTNAIRPYYHPTIFWANAIRPYRIIFSAPSIVWANRIRPFSNLSPRISFLSLVVFIYQVLTLVPVCILCGVFHTIKFIIYANNNFYHPVFSILAICFE